MKKRLCSMLLAACMVFTGMMVPIAASGTVSVKHPDNEAAPECTCISRCTEDIINADCPVCKNGHLHCTKEGAMQSEALAALYAFADTMPYAKDVTDENKETVMADVEYAIGAYERLSDEDRAIFDISEQMIKLMALRDAVYDISMFAGDVVGSFQIANGLAETDYSYDGTAKVLTIKTGTPMTITMNTGSDWTSDRLVIAEGNTANITVQGIDIRATDKSGVQLGAGATLNLTVKGNNAITTSAVLYAGVEVSDGETLHIQGTGTLNVKGGSNGAGIGGNSQAVGGTIAISNGTIIAGCSSGGAAIGGGYNAAGGKTTITGGIITATGCTSSAGIGGGSKGAAGTILIDGDVVLFASGYTAIGAGSNGAETGTVTKTKGFIFEEAKGTVYGEVALPADITIPSKIGSQRVKSLIPEGAKLTIPINKELNFEVGDFTVVGALENNGTLTVGATVEGDGSYTGSGKLGLQMAMILPPADLVYSGAPKEVRVQFLDHVFTMGVDYSVTYTPENQTDIGKKTATVTPLSGALSGSARTSSEFTIVKATTNLGSVKSYKDITETSAFAYGDTITVKFTPVASASGKALTPPVVTEAALFFENTQLSAPQAVTFGNECTLTYSTLDDLLAFGTHTLTVKYIGGSNATSSTGTVAVTLSKKVITPDIEAIAAQSYTGRQIKPTVIVKDGSSVLPSTAYTISYGTNIAVGSGNVTVTLKGNYSGTNTADFTIEKASAAGGNQTFEFVEGTVASYTYDLDTLLPVVTSPATLGNVRYATSSGAGNVLSGNATIIDNIITLPVQGVSAGTTQAVTIRITSDHYTVTDATLTLKAVSKIPLNITAIMENRTYNSLPQGYVGTPTFALADGTSVGAVTYKVEYEGVAPTVYTKTPTAPTKAGTYKVVMKVDGSSAATYSGSLALPFAINEAALRVTADSTRITVGAALPMYTATTVGLMTGETISNIAFSGGPADTNTKGSFIITPSGGNISSGDNYNISYITGTLTIAIDSTALDAAIAKANAVKNGVIISDSAADAVSKGTKFVATAEMQALTDAIAAAHAAITSAVSEAEVTAAATELDTAVQNFTNVIKIGMKNSSTGGGGGSYIKPTPPIVTTPIPDKPNTPSVGTATIEGTVNENGEASATITEDAITDALVKAQEEAKKNGKEPSDIALVIQVNTNAGGKTVHSMRVNLPKVVQERVINQKIVNTIVVLNQPDVRVGMNLAAVTEINRQAQADVNLTATRLNQAKLTGDAKATVGIRPVFDLKMSYRGKQLNHFGSGTVSVSIPYTMQPQETAGNLHGIYVDVNGKIQWLKNSSYDVAAKLLRFSTNHFSTYAVAHKGDTSVFGDIAAHPARNDIEFAVARGLLIGADTDTFAPNSPVTRGMLASALGRLAGIDTNSHINGMFSDVSATKEYAPYVNWASLKGIIPGKTTAVFAPDAYITRQEMACIMQNYAKVMNFTLPKTRDLVIFADWSSIADNAKEAVKWMQMAGIMMGKKDNMFIPATAVTKAEVSAILHRYVELVIDRTTAQGFEKNDSGQVMYYVDGKPFIGIITIDSVTYLFGNDGILVQTDAEPEPSPVPIPEKTNYFFYKVAAGDTLLRLSRKYQCTVAELVKLNGIKNPHIIHKGILLKIPQK